MLKVIKNQKYQTRAEVGQAAKTSRKAAIRSSIRHWNELATAPVSDLVSLDKYPNLGLAGCALCRRYLDDDCRACPLHKITRCKCYDADSLYGTAREPFIAARNAATKKYKDIAIKCFRRAAEKMIRVLESCLEI